jgi:hypothetical protein
LAAQIPKGRFVALFLEGNAVVFGLQCVADASIENPRDKRWTLGLNLAAQARCASLDLDRTVHTILIQ